MATTFDTLAAAEALEAARVKLEHAKAHTMQLRAVIDSASAAAGTDREYFATKADFATLETRLTWRMVGIMVGLLAAQGALIVGLVVGLLQPLPQ